MAATFVPISEYDSKDLRKELDLPYTKQLKYMEHKKGNTYVEIQVVDYEVAGAYSPSGMKSLTVSLVNGRKVRILAPFFSQMQKSSFIQDMINGGKE
ncbi:hypothetical protein lbkm_0026 [Lachnospiraceae bacterium KM106-2]|nr:hypothetical protein lbkm_0026 [Lachnospiraceae bacterium KM106-2]